MAPLAAGTTVPTHGLVQLHKQEAPRLQRGVVVFPVGRSVLRFYLGTHAFSLPPRSRWATAPADWCNKAPKFLHYRLCLAEVLHKILGFSFGPDWLTRLSEVTRAVWAFRVRLRGTLVLSILLILGIGIAVATGSFKRCGNSSSKAQHDTCSSSELSGCIKLSFEVVTLPWKANDIALKYKIHYRGQLTGVRRKVSIGTTHHSFWLDRKAGLGHHCCHAEDIGFSTILRMNRHLVLTLGLLFAWFEGALLHK